MNKPDEKKSRWTRFSAWVNGKSVIIPEEDLFPGGDLRPAPGKKCGREFCRSAEREGERLYSFLSGYTFAAVVVGVIVIGILMATVMALPRFGQPDNPTNNEVSQRYLEKGEEETGAPNAVSGMILNYRGFDTFGESCVLFLAVSCVFMLLLRDEKNTHPKDLAQIAREEAADDSSRDVILQQVSSMIIPFIFLFGIYTLLNGHLSPGGGFSGGSMLGGGLILYVAAYGSRKIQRFFNGRVYNIARVCGLMLYAILFGYYIFTGANGLPNHIPLSIGGLILPIDVAVGLVVACTMYGFYAMFTKGEL